MEDLEVRFYKNLVSRSEIKVIRYVTLYIFEIYGRIVVRLKIIKF